MDSMDSMDTSQVPGEKLGATVAANIFSFFPNTYFLVKKRTNVGKVRY